MNDSSKLEILFRIPERRKEWMSKKKKKKKQAQKISNFTLQEGIIIIIILKVFDVMYNISNTRSKKN